MLWVGEVMRCESSMGEWPEYMRNRHIWRSARSRCVTPLSELLYWHTVTVTSQSGRFVTSTEESLEGSAI